eukprot:TRINITY_DN2687_c1_g2_i1.p1 TRINITY_DN2687_c1_g2~~TRINITY_DN2687_c1_g2_i1.p1  ORF type:complete len:104 (-),score=21.29 TRINITY_DN2687_c1_g2_i1:819-1130(-)
MEIKYFSFPLPLSFEQQSATNRRYNSFLCQPWPKEIAWASAVIIRKNFTTAKSAIHLTSINASRRRKKKKKKKIKPHRLDGKFGSQTNSFCNNDDLKVGPKDK